MKLSFFPAAYLVPLLFSSSIMAQADHIPSSWSLPSHPRILLLKGEEAAIRKTIGNDTVWMQLEQAILDASDQILPTAPVERIKIGRRLLDKSREALRRIFFLSYAYRMTGEQKYADRAQRELLAVAAFSDWNPSHFLDVAEMTMAVSIGYDWLYDKLSPQSRTLIKEAILKKGIEPSLDPKNNGWLRVEHNWNQVCNAGMCYGAMAIYEDDPTLARQIINRSINAVPHAMQDYAPDGVYPEGYGYWGYGTSFNVMLISALDKLFGNDSGLSDMPGFLKTAGFLENMTGPSGRPFNYSDAGEGGGLEPAMFWFASKLKDPSLLWVERSRLLNDGAKNQVRNRLLPAVLLWGQGIDLNNIQPPGKDMWTGQGKNPVALMRTSWTDPNAIYVAMKGGSVSVNHAHMDVGSFVMDADGVRWAMDFGMQEYESLESKGLQIFGRSQDAQRWTVFRYSNLVHNTITVNGLQQRVTGRAPITSSSAATTFMDAITDLTPVYTGAVAKANRGIAIVDQQYVVVRDEIRALDTPTTIRWTLLTRASVKITGENTAELTKDGRKLFLRVHSPDKVSMKTWSTDPPHNYDAPNPGTIMVGFELQIPAGASTESTVELIPEKAMDKADKKIAPLQNWNAHGS